MPSHSSIGRHTDWQVKRLTYDAVASLSGGLPVAVITHTEVVPGEVWHAEREVRINSSGFEDREP